MYKLHTTLFLMAVMALQSCHKTVPRPPLDADILEGTVDGLSEAQLNLHQRGDVAFNEVFTTATGLGPWFVANSCASCHAGDGKGTPFTILTRFGQHDSSGNMYLNAGAPQLQHRAIPGHVPETLPAGAPSARFMAPANTGLGYLELVSDADLVAMADPGDADGDGISGRVNWCVIPGYIMPRQGALTSNGKYIGRFGKKASVYDLLQQTVNAYNQDMGITSVYVPHETYPSSVSEPEVSQTVINELVFYLRTLKTPLRRDESNAGVQEGARIFSLIGCESCHRSTLKTMPGGEIQALSAKEFHPYTDLLLHDMGKGLDDGYTEGNALSSEWRTAPLWGLGLSGQSQGGSYFLLHDGRAHSVEEAIELHGGEALKSRNSYMQLKQADRDNLIKFLRSL